MGENKDIRRREFLKKAGLAGAIAMIVLASCAPAAPTPTTAPTKVPPTVAPGVPTPTPCLKNPGDPDLCQGSGGTLVVSGYAEPGPLDPAIGSGEITMTHMQPIYEGIWGRDLTVPTTGSAPPLIGKLAESWEWSPDVLELTVKLRENVKFHDGTPWNAEAAQFNVYRIIKEDFEWYYPQGAAMSGWIYWGVEDVEVVDEYTIRFVFSEPKSFFIEKMAEPCGIGTALMVSPAAVKEYGNEGLGEHPVGTGPFVFVERERAVKTVYERNPDYWNPDPLKRAHVDRLIIIPTVDSAVRVAMLRAGEVDFLHGAIPVEEVPRLLAEGYELGIGTFVIFGYISINMENPAMQDLRVRQALNYLMDREKFIADMMMGYGFPWYQTCSASCSSYITDWAPYKFDPEKGVALLKEAGYGPDNPLHLKFELFEIETWRRYVEWLQMQWRPYGIELELDVYEWQTYIARWGTGMPPDVAMNIMGWGMNTDWWWHHPFRSRNTGNVDDPLIDELLDKSDAELDDEERTEICKEINRRDREMAYHIPFYASAGECMYSPRVKGFFWAIDHQRDFRLMWIEED